MKTLLKKLVFAFLPALLAVVFFFAFEPYDYFGVKGHSAYLSKSVSALRELLRDKPENIVLGASQMANLNTDYIKEVSGEDYTMLAFGGANMNECIDEFWYATEHTDLKKVVFGVNFYILNIGGDDSRTPYCIDAAENVFVFMSRFNYWLEAINCCKNELLGLAADVTGNESLRVVEDDPSSLTQDDPVFTDETIEGYRKDLYEYSDTILNQMSQYSKLADYVTQLQEIAAYCDENGIELTFVMPPCNRVIWDRVIIPNDYIYVMNYYKNLLKPVANCVDFEFYTDFASDDANFIDGFHVVKENKLMMARVIFGDEDAPKLCVKTTREQYAALKGE